MNKYIVIFLMVVLSIFFVDDMRIRGLQKEQFYEIYLENVIDNALVDAANSMSMTGDKYQEASSGIHPYEILSKFFESISFSLGYHHEDINEFKNYIPFILLIDGDGFYIYKLDEFKEGTLKIAHRLYPKEYFSYMDEDAVYGFDTDLNIHIYDKKDASLILSLNAKESSEIVKYSDGYALLREVNLDKKIKDLMYRQLEDNINAAFHSHHSLSDKKGIFYQFEWKYDVEKFDIFRQKSGIAFLIQGLPLIGNEEFEYIAFNRFEARKKDFVYGFIKDGVRYRSKKHPKKMGYDLVEIFSSDREAAKSGYYLYRD